MRISDWSSDVCSSDLRFALRSKDVIHSFWVPSWGLKRAVVPGQVQTLVVTPTRMVETVANSMARVQCSQICGAGHAEMQAVARVVSQADFTAWVEAARAAARHGHARYRHAGHGDA